MKDTAPWTTFPKIELHDHLDGSLRPQTVIDLAAHQGLRLPATEPADLARLLSPGPSSLEEYLGAFAVTVAVLQTAPALRRVARELVEDWKADGVVYGEVRFAPELHTGQGLSRAAVVEAVLQGLHEGLGATGLAGGVLLCSMRHGAPSLETARLVRQYRNDGVVGFDLAGAEAPYPASLHRAAFEFCAENLLAATCHAGEVTGPEAIREALVACRALRIGHGTQLIQEWGTGRRDPGPGTLTAWIRERRVALELCLTSNLQTRAVASLADHPFDEFRRAGLRVTLNTDNRLVSRTTLSRELGLAAQTWGLSPADLRRVQLDALDAAFCTAVEKAAIRTQHFGPDADTLSV